MGICLNKQKLMYKVLAPSINNPYINSYRLMEALDSVCVGGWLSVKEIPMVSKGLKRLGYLLPMRNFYLMRIIVLIRYRTYI